MGNTLSVIVLVLIFVVVMARRLQPPNFTKALLIIKKVDAGWYTKYEARSEFGLLGSCFGKTIFGAPRNFAEVGDTVTFGSYGKVKIKRKEGVDRFINRGGSVFDSYTGLEWQKRRDATWDDAITFQDDGWRLPSIEELDTLVDRSLFCPASIFPGQDSALYWSSSPSVCDLNRVWAVGFGLGDVGQLHKDYKASVRLVRTI